MAEATNAATLDGATITARQHRQEKEQNHEDAIREHERKWTAAMGGERNVTAKDLRVGVNAVIY